MKTIIIPYNENKNREILTALRYLRHFGDLKFEDCPDIVRQFMIYKEDLSYTPPSLASFSAIVKNLDLSKYTFKVIDC